LRSHNVRFGKKTTGGTGGSVIGVGVGERKKNARRKHCPGGGRGEKKTEKGGNGREVR